MTGVGGQTRGASAHTHADPPADTTALPEYVPALDGIRGFAVLAVVLVHLRPGLVPNYDDIERYLSGGALGVDMFFVLSGFLISSILLRERTRGDRLTLKPFYLRRATRLLPALTAFLLAYSAYGLLTHQSTTVVLSTVVAGVTYSTNWYLAFHNVADFLTMSHLWSLALEEQFYLVWPAAFMLLISTRRSTRTTLWFCAAAIVALWLLRINDWATWYTTLHHSALEISGTLYAGSLLIGAAAAVIGVRPFAGTRILPIAATIASGVMLWIFTVGDTYSKFVNYGGLEVFAVCVAIIILAIVEQRWIGSKFWALKPLRLTGRVSYGIYLWHPLVFTAVLHYTPTWHWYSRLILSAAAIAGATAFSWYLVEQPAQRLRKRLTSVPASPSVPAGPQQRDATSDRIRGFKVLATGSTLVSIGILVAYALPGSPSTAVAAGTPTANTRFTNLQPRNGAGRFLDVNDIRKRAGAKQKGILRALVTGDSVVIDLVGKSEALYESAHFQGLGTSFYGCGIGDSASILVGQLVPFPTICTPLSDSYRANSKAFLPDVAVLVTGSTEARDYVVAGKTLAVGTPAFEQYMLGRLDAVREVLAPGQQPFVLATVLCEDTSPGIVDPRRAAIDALWRKYATLRRGVTIADLTAFACPDGRPGRTADGTPIIDHGLFTKKGAMATWAFLAEASKSAAKG